MIINSFFPLIWRGEKIKLNKKENKLPLGEAYLIRIEKKFIDVISNFICYIFNYDDIKVSLIKIPSKNKQVGAYSSGDLELDNGSVRFLLAVKLFNDQFYEFNVTNIPAKTDSRHIRIFFDVLSQYMRYFYERFQNDLPIENGKLIASPDFIAKNEIWIYNIERTIIIEYIYNIFNTFDQNYSNPNKLLPIPPRYDLDLINKILDFAYLLSTTKIENKEIYCGFIFHDKANQIRFNSVRSIEFQDKFDFGNFGQLKNYLEISNGQNIFFNVTDKKITHLFVTREKLNEIYINPIGGGKTFQQRPLILSIQGAGKIYFIEGRLDFNRIILQITNSHPIIRDNDFIQDFICDQLKKFVNVKDNYIQVFAKWIMSLTQKKHGTSLLFTSISKKDENKFVKTIKISPSKNGLFDRHDLYLLDRIVNPDGAVLFNKKLIPTHISTILPISKSTKHTSGGARHNSVANYTKEFKCLGIVISEDGPITIFKDGKKLIKF